MLRASSLLVTMIMARISDLSKDVELLYALGFLFSSSDMLVRELGDLTESVFWDGDYYLFFILWFTAALLAMFWYWSASASSSEGLSTSFLANFSTGTVTTGRSVCAFHATLLATYGSDRLWCTARSTANRKAELGKVLRTNRLTTVRTTAFTFVPRLDFINRSTSQKSIKATFSTKAGRHVI